MPLDIAVLSPEKTVLTYRLAGLGSRALAHFIDCLIILATIILLYVLVILFAGLTFGVLPDLSYIAIGVVAFVVSLLPFAYFVFFEGFWNGQTIGKRMAGIRVRMADGTPITFAASTGRNLLRVADFLPVLYFLGTVAMFVNPKLQRVGDLVAGTIVTHEVRVVPTFSIAPHRVGIHSLENLVGELRNMTDAQYYVLRRYCDRFPELPSDVQNHLTDTVWLPMAEALGVKMQSQVHPLYLAEATVMKYGRVRGLL
ncbi:MAG: RDD family protein [Armatimonadota bacterium]